MAARQPAAGDVVVTKVVSHYHVSRVQPDGKAFETLTVTNVRAEALGFACEAISGRQRVFLYSRADMRECIMIDCANLSDDDR